MPTITITVPDVGVAIDAFADCAHRYGLDAVTITTRNGDAPPAPVAAPAKRKKRFVPPTMSKATLAKIINTVTCPNRHCTGEVLGQRCGTLRSPYYDHVHVARREAWERSSLPTAVTPTTPVVASPAD